MKGRRGLPLGMELPDNQQEPDGSNGNEEDNQDEEALSQ